MSPLDAALRSDSAAAAELKAMRADLEHANDAGGIAQLDMCWAELRASGRKLSSVSTSCFPTSEDCLQSFSN